MNKRDGGRNRASTRPLPALGLLGAVMAFSGCGFTGEFGGGGQNVTTESSTAATVTPSASPFGATTTSRYKNPPVVTSSPGALESTVRSDYRWIEYTVPVGWEIREPYIGKNLGQPDEVALSFWTTSGVYADPCHRAGTKLNALDLMQHDHAGVDGETIVLLNPGEGGLAVQAGRNASEPENAIIGGQQALRFELTVPKDLDIESCDDGVYRSWPSFSAPDTGNDNHIAGQTDIIYMVDVDRSPILIDASHRPQSDAEDLAELESVLASLLIKR